MCLCFSIHKKHTTTDSVKSWISADLSKLLQLCLSYVAFLAFFADCCLCARKHSSFITKLATIWKKASMRVGFYSCYADMLGIYLCKSICCLTKVILSSVLVFLFSRGVGVVLLLPKVLSFLYGDTSIWHCISSSTVWNESVMLKWNEMLYDIIIIEL